jgi:predicted Fe-Mo cluster-binding NifX family protein
VIRLKIGITAEGSSKDSPVAMHFGKAPYIVLINLEDAKSGFIYLGYEHHKHTLGEVLKKLGVNVFITGGMGLKAAEVFVKNGIRLYQVPRKVSVREAVELYKKGSLVEFSSMGTHRHSHCKCNPHFTHGNNVKSTMER